MSFVLRSWLFVLHTSYPNNAKIAIILSLTFMPFPAILSNQIRKTSREIKNTMRMIISVIADIITILGIGGIVSWSIFRKNKTSLDQTIIGILLFGVKVSLIVLLLWPFFFLFYATHLFILVFFRDTFGFQLTYPMNEFWDSNTSTPYIISYLVNAILLLPCYALLSLWILKRPLLFLWRLFGFSKNDDII